MKKRVNIFQNDFLVLSPENINYEDLAKSNEKLNLNIPKGIIGDIIKILAKNHSFDEKDQLGQRRKIIDYKVSLCSVLLHEIYGNDYKQGIKMLIVKHLFKYPYSESNCYKYMLNDKTRSFNLKIEKLETKTTKGRGIVKRIKEQDVKTSSVIKKKFNYMIKFFNDKKLKIDLEECINIIEQEYLKTNNYINYLADFQKVINIHNGLYKFHNNPETDSRLHSNFTFLNKKFRKHLTYDGKKIVEIDLSNSIPTIFSFLLSNSINVNIKSIINTILYDYLLMFNKKSKDVDIYEIELFNKLCVEGKIYEELTKGFLKENINHLMNDYDGYIDESGYHFDEEFDKTKITKSSFLSMLFSENETFINMEIAFEKMFPSIFNFIKEIKRKGSYKLFSHFLFQIESEIVLNQIARSFNALQNGKVPIFTIHDCVCTTEGNELILEDFIKKRTIELFGVQLNYKIKYL